MQKTCVRESYVLSPGRVLSSFLSENRVPITKERIMTTTIPRQKSKKPTSVRSRGRVPHVPVSIVAQRPEELYYSILVPAVEKTDPYITIVSDARKDVLRITMVCVSIYEAYLFALGLPSNFPKEQIIVFGQDRVRYIPCRSCEYGEKLIYHYELTLPADTAIEEYQQRIFNDLNDHFQLDVKVEQLSIVTDSRPVTTENGESVELFWEDQTTVIMRKNRN
ncbi:hypothetical protein [Sphingobacterium faecium]|uniref:hypothetical protein n=1 Tax=Sphingobacterium faecium TaxID=34087 RepID=UPI003207AD08